MTDTIRDAVARAIDPYAWPTQPGEPMRECGEPFRERAGRIADIAIAAHLAALEAQGFVVVPREPTAAMLRAGCDVDIVREGHSGVWRAMIAAIKAGV